MAQCKSVTSDGATRCKRGALPGRLYCWQHETKGFKNLAKVLAAVGTPIAGAVAFWLNLSQLGILPTFHPPTPTAALGTSVALAPTPTPTSTLLPLTVTPTIPQSDRQSADPLKGTATKSTSTVTPTATPTLPPPTVLPTATPTRFRVLTGTIGAPVIVQEPTGVAGSHPTLAPASLPTLAPGMGTLVVLNYYGQQMNYTIEGILHTIPGNNNCIIPLAPGRHPFSANIPGVGGATGEVDISPGKYYQQFWAAKP